jgi:hypothetical protein|nr:MAG TPA: hypothetical protein [Caudoviricetes sp.]
MKVKIRVTKSLYAATIFAAVMVTANTALMVYVDFTNDAMNVTRDSLWCVGAIILWAGVRVVRFMRTVGYYPGFHRK